LVQKTEILITAIQVNLTIISVEERHYLLLQLRNADSLEERLIALLKLTKQSVDISALTKA